MDPYELLGLEKGDDEETIKAAFTRVKEMYYPNCSTELVPITEIDNERFLEYQNAYKKILKEKKALEKISRVRPLEEMPVAADAFSDIYGQGAFSSREDGTRSADDSQVSSFDAWTGMELKPKGDNQVALRQEGQSIYSFGPARTKASEALGQMTIDHSIEKFLDFSLFDLRSFDKEAVYFYNAMTALQQHDADGAKRNLNRTTLNPPVWYYLMAITSYFEKDYIYARRNAVGAYTMETDNVHFWQLSKFLEGYESGQRDKEMTFGPTITMDSKTKFKIVRRIVFGVLAAVLLAAAIIIIGKAASGLNQEYNALPDINYMNPDYDGDYKE